MMSIPQLRRDSQSRRFGHAGFTLIELMIGVAISTIAVAAMYALYEGIQKNSQAQAQVAVMQQNLRGSIILMEREMRAAGMSRQMPKPNTVGFLDVRRFNATAPGTVATPNPNGFPALRVGFDSALLGEPSELLDIAYLLYDRENTGRNDLARGLDYGAGRELLAEAIEAIGFAYAFDRNDNGRLERQNGNIVWAVDANNDGRLDTLLDVDNDGTIDISDVGATIAQDTNGDGVIDLRDIGGPLGFNVTADRIRAVMVWVLARTNRPDPKFINTEAYVVGDRLIGPMNDNFRRRVYVEMINSRNM
ncbi:MAG: prepilin-type N-terminal cleavage/methylation domain-containing protein [Desulfatitalea sp.]|nr:prepilin-type N-terminal cleavage/methylation domain-containing protein [Desulfatitalea sp.]